MSMLVMNELTRGWGRVAVWVCAVGLAVVVGCHRDGIDPPVLPPVDAGRVDVEVPTRGEVVRRHNEAVAGLDRVWASTDATLRWEDPESGKVRKESGEGVLVMVEPRRVTLTMGKLGKTGLWAGCNEERYWLFDIQDRGEEEAWVGTHEDAGRACAEPLPLPLPPDAVPWLLGVRELPVPGVGKVGVEKGYWVLEVEPDEEAGLSYRLRMYVNPETSRPAVVEMLDTSGENMLTCYLSEYAPVEQHDAPRADWPTMPTRVRCFTADGKAELTLSLQGVSDGEGQINDAAFDFEVLLKAYTPRVVHDLDAGCG